MGENTRQSLKSLIECIKDPFDNRGKKYSIHETIILLIVGCICCKKLDYTNIAHYLKQREKELKKFLELKNGIPSHDTMNRHIQRLDEKELTYTLCDWFCMILHNKYPHIIIDGKALKAACEKVKNKNVPYVLNAIDQITKIVLMQIGIEEKTNEITTIPKILNLLDIKDTVITIDAIGTQIEITQMISQRGGYYVLPVKKNQIQLNDDIELYVEDLIKSNSDDVDIYIEKDYKDKHGRETTRKYYYIKESELKNERFTSMIGVGKVERISKIIKKDDEGNEIKDEYSTQIVYYITNIQDLEVKDFAKYIRNHWTIENSLHWVLDNDLDEDRSTIRKSKNKAALIRKAAYNIVRMHIEKEAEGTSFSHCMVNLEFNLPTLFSYITEPISL